MCSMSPPEIVPKQLAALARYSPSRSFYCIVVFIWLSALIRYIPLIVHQLIPKRSVLDPIAIGIVVLFAAMSWLYGIQTLATYAFALYYRWGRTYLMPDTTCQADHAAVAILYTVCNDF